MSVDMNVRWQDLEVVKKDGMWTVAGRPRPAVAVAFQESPSNIPDHYYLGLKVTAPVNAATPPHTHGGAAIVATMTKGKVLNQMVCPHHDPDSQGTGPKIYSVGESWYEPPGCHHVRSENVGDEEAEVIAVFVVSKQKVDDEGLQSLVVIDAEVEERNQAK
ncbi:hypothetical protein G647_07975 [Cladophialophora carrionii CBS 160.54]|uniref:Cupin type-1 domain-containing protein n=1 Tax=Cladophialophora carrionii CBS 160.54 TaxID=1279043 RepID=V9D5Q5_9EURO|nr:uncharacterized protein G647_07975 [Cladophialophora carrionii CBS 160.54]ETI21628.1 hypothetical protein G647_07975 [Cladophialophora carrionii CBS 160.54]